jgi:excinuclease UvrABC nuclease subunit
MYNNTRGFTPEQIRCLYGYGWNSWWEESRREKEIPEKPGVYVIYICAAPFYNPVYIGSTQNLKKRIGSHEVIRVATGLLSRAMTIKYKVVSDIDKMINLEYALINKIKPLINKAGKNNG